MVDGQSTQYCRSNKGGFKIALADGEFDQVPQIAVTLDLFALIQQYRLGLRGFVVPALFVFADQH